MTDRRSIDDVSSDAVVVLVIAMLGLLGLIIAGVMVGSGWTLAVAALTALWSLLSFRIVDLLGGNVKGFSKALARPINAGMTHTLKFGGAIASVGLVAVGVSSIALESPSTPPVAPDSYFDRNSTISDRVRGLNRTELTEQLVVYNSLSGNDKAIKPGGIPISLQGVPAEAEYVDLRLNVREPGSERYLHLDAIGEPQLADGRDFIFDGETWRITVHRPNNDYLFLNNDASFQVAASVAVSAVFTPEPVPTDGSP